MPRLSEKSQPSLLLHPFDPFDFETGRGEKAGKQSTTQVQGFKFSAPTTHPGTSKQRAGQQSERDSDTSLKLVVYSAARFQ